MIRLPTLSPLRACAIFAAIACCAMAFSPAALAQSPMDDEVLAISASDVPKLWKLVRKDPQIRVNQTKYRAGCASFGYIIESNGKTNGVSIMRAWPDPEFGDAVQKYVRRWRFEPTVNNPKKQAIYTVQLYTLIMEGTETDTGTHIPAKINEEELAKLCEVKSMHIGN
jgi:hypothetical protein